LYFSSDIAEFRTAYLPNVSFNLHLHANLLSLLKPDFTLISWAVYSPNLKIEMTYSSETSVDFQWTRVRYRTLHNDLCGNPKPYNNNAVIRSISSKNAVIKLISIVLKCVGGDT
jgi:hypothetical protein